MLNVTHRPGKHCASVALRDLAEFHGLQLDEAFCFGLGGGLGIWYFVLEAEGLDRLIHVRSADLEEQFFKRLGQPFVWQRFEVPEEAEKALCLALDQGRPALLQTDIYYLPYYKSKTHFPGHAICVWGYDKGKQVFQVTDTAWEEVLEVGFEDLRKARYCSADMFEVKGNMYAPERIKNKRSWEEIALEAILQNSLRILDKKNAWQGLQGLEKWSQELPKWKELCNWKWTTRFTYQIIERRGTGGGGFRILYADFLKTVQKLVPKVKKAGLEKKMRSLGQAWTDLALALKEVSTKKVPDFGLAVKKLEKVMLLEKDYHQSVLSLKDG